MNKKFSTMLEKYFIVMHQPFISKGEIVEIVDTQSTIILKHFKLNDLQQERLIEFLKETYTKAGRDWIINRPKVLQEASFLHPELAQKSVSRFYVYLIGLQHEKVKVRKQIDTLIDMIEDETLHEETIDLMAFDWVTGFLPYEYTYKMDVVDILFKKFRPSRVQMNGTRKKK